MPSGIPVFTSTISDGLKLTLDEVVDDNLTTYKSKLIMPKWMKQSNMEDNYEDDLEMAGPGLAAEKSEGAEMQAGSIQAGARLPRAMYKTVDIDATTLLQRAVNPLYTGGDGVSLANIAHPLPGGGVFSNLMTTPMSPSRIAVATATTQMRKFPGHDGTIEGVEPVANLCPEEQWYIWDR